MYVETNYFNLYYIFMLKIENIRKTYRTGDLVQTALNGVSLNLRDNEFVAILGPSGSGKTTLLNIIGGLDRYDDGDLIINNVSTKKYKDRDWDSYRNHTIGFIFQSYNLIPHQSVLSNVELALTIAGISSKERKQRALDALEEVGLKEQAHKRPNQMSGGQMQRVAIARALVNNPDILLADEPTGALDTKTSIQVMELLKKVAKDRLVVMVTHNPELAEEYANRIVRLQDGNIISDSNPYNIESEEYIEPEERNFGKAKMGFFTALSLSFNNLLTKKGRTILTAFAGSIGIIGIALILALSTGFQNYIDKIQEDTMTSYPLQLNSETTDMFSAILAMNSQGSNEQADETLREQQYISSMVNALGTNDLKSFKHFLENNEDLYEGKVKRIKYAYSVSPLIYGRDVTGKLVQLNPSTAMSSIYSGAMTSAISMMSTSSGVFNEGTINPDKYEILKGRLPENELEVAIILPDKDKISDLLLYSLGFKENAKLKSIITDLMTGEEAKIEEDPITITYDDLLNLELKLINPADMYKLNTKYSTYEDMSKDNEYMERVFRDSEQLKVTGLLWSENGNSSGVIFSPDLVYHVIDKAEETTIVKKQLRNKDVDVFSGNDFNAEPEDKEGLDFNDMVSIDEEMLKNAFKFNLSEDDFKFDSIDQDEMTNIVMKQAEETAKTIASGPNVTQLTAMFAGANSAVVQGTVGAYEKNHVVPVFDDSTSENPTIVGLKLNLIDEDIDALVTSVDANAYKAGLSQVISTLGPESAAILQILTDDDYSNLAEASRIMLKDYFERIKGNSGYDSENKNIDYSFDESTLISTYGSDTPVSSRQLMAIEMMNSSALSKTSTAVNNIINNFTTYMIAAGIGQATGKVMTPMMESLGKLGDLFSGDIMTVDTDAFAKAFNFDMNEDEISRLMESMLKSDSASYKANLIKLGYQDVDDPTSISIFFTDFESKNAFIDILEDYNDKADEEQEISYTDITGILMSSVETIINSVTYVLIAFVSISLIVSSIMIAVITLISVMERTKEIGILRAMGASKKNVSSIFNAETFIIGLLSGGLGVGVTYSLIPIINTVIHNVTDNYDINAVLEPRAAIILVLISVFLTIVAGLIPSGKAAKQDPVIALRSE